MINHITGILNSFKVNINALYEHILSAENYKDFMEDSTYEILELPNAEQVKNIESIDLNGIYFKYENQTSYALQNISLSLKRGERIAVVGLNGAGKTTLINILLSLYAPEKGQVLINNKNICDIDLSSYYKRIGVIFQNHNEYSITIGENILLSEFEQKDEATIWDSLEQVGLLEKVKNASLKLNTELTHLFDSNGIDFSGGERQRLSIARAIAKDCDLYIMDEPSSSLDAQAEEELFSFVRNIPRDKSIIFISHRLSSVIHSDRIIVMGNGQIIGTGTHNELMTTCHAYKTMYNLQADRYTQKDTP